MLGTLKLIKIVVVVIITATFIHLYYTVVIIREVIDTVSPEVSNP